MLHHTPTYSGAVISTLTHLLSIDFDLQAPEEFQSSLYSNDIIVFFYSERKILEGKKVASLHYKISHSLRGGERQIDVLDEMLASAFIEDNQVQAMEVKQSPENVSNTLFELLKGNVNSDTQEGIMENQQLFSHCTEISEKLESVINQYFNYRS